MRNKMRIGIAGSHRVGKTTLAKALVKTLDIPYVPANVSKAAVWAHAHISPSEHVTFSERLHVQEGILSHMMGVVRSDNAVYDRTFIDFVGYLYSNIDHTCSNLFNDQVLNFVGRCLNAQTRYFDKIIIVQPGIDAVVDEGKFGKVYMSQSYMQAMNNNVIATAINYLDPSKFLIIPTNVLDHQTRVDISTKFVLSN